MFIAFDVPRLVAKKFPSQRQVREPLLMVSTRKRTCLRFVMSQVYVTDVLSGIVTGASELLTWTLRSDCRTTAMGLQLPGVADGSEVASKTPVTPLKVVALEISKVARFSLMALPMTRG